MDEPTIGLDPITKRILWDLVEELHSEDVQSSYARMICTRSNYCVIMLGS